MSNGPSDRSCTFAATNAWLTAETTQHTLQHNTNYKFDSNTTHHTARSTCTQTGTCTQLMNVYPSTPSRLQHQNVTSLSAHYLLVTDAKCNSSSRSPFHGAVSPDHVRNPNQMSYTVCLARRARNKCTEFRSIMVFVHIFAKRERPSMVVPRLSHARLGPLNARLPRCPPSESLCSGRWVEGLLHLTSTALGTGTMFASLHRVSGASATPDGWEITEKPTARMFLPLLPVWVSSSDMIAMNLNADISLIWRVTGSSTRRCRRAFRCDSFGC